MNTDNDLRQALKRRERFTPDAAATGRTALAASVRRTRDRRRWAVGLIAALVIGIGVAASLLGVARPNATPGGSAD